MFQVQEFEGINGKFSMPHIVPDMLQAMRSSDTPKSSAAPSPVPSTKSDKDAKTDKPEAAAKTAAAADDSSAKSGDAKDETADGDKATNDKDSESQKAIVSDKGDKPEVTSEVKDDAMETDESEAVAKEGADKDKDTPSAAGGDASSKAGDERKEEAMEEGEKEEKKQTTTAADDKGSFMNLPLKKII